MKVSAEKLKKMKLHKQIALGKKPTSPIPSSAVSR